MKFRQLRSTFLALGLLGQAALAQDEPRSPPIKPLAFTERTLPNGLRVYAIRNTGTSNVAVQVWYRVGSKDDPRGRSGFAHLFEHLMFKATRNLAPEQMDRLTEDVGGYNNAVTRDDYTSYFEYVPANNLEPLLFAEAERMSSLVVDEASLASERNVVKDELLRSTTARPYGKLLTTYLSASEYVRHPYARSTIGNADDLEAATLDQVRLFHQTYYRPDNAILVVAGNFDPASLDRWVDGYFGGIARPEATIPRVSVQEPPRTQAVSFTVRDPDAPSPAVVVSWHVPPPSHPDTPALTVLTSILGRGDSSRLASSLVQGTGVAREVQASLDLRQSTGNLVIKAFLARGGSTEQGEAAVRKEVARLRRDPVTSEELLKARNQVVADAVRDRETAEGQAQTLALSVMLAGEPGVADRQLAAVSAITAADLQRVAREYLRDEQSSVIRQVVSEGGRVASGPSIAPAATVEVADLRPAGPVTASARAPEASRRKPPAPSAPVRAQISDAVVVRLPNGLQVATLERHDLPLVTMTLVARGGAAIDPPSRGGAAYLAADTIIRGTTTRTAKQISFDMDALGATMSTRTDLEGASIDVTVTSTGLDRAAAIVADVVRNPVLRTEEFERSRRRAVETAAVQLRDTGRLADLLASRMTFGPGPFGEPVGGTPASLASLSPDDIERARASTFRPDRSMLVFVGDVTPRRARALAERLFAGWRATDPPPAPARAVSRPSSGRVVVVDVPDAPQAGVALALPGISRSDPRFYALTVANAVLGGSYSSRLNQELRIRRGLTYWAGSEVKAWETTGLLTARAQTASASAVEAARLMKVGMNGMLQTPPTAGEIEARRTLLAGIYGMTVETTEGAARALRNSYLQGMPPGEAAAYPGKVLAVHGEDVTDAATLLDPSRAVMAIAGDARTLIPQLEKAFGAVEVVSTKDLHLQ